MTRRESAIEGAVNDIVKRGESFSRALGNLIDMAEAGKLKEPLPIHCAGVSGLKIFHDDGRVETQ